MEEDRKKIVLAGGGTLGSVSPLLAVAEKYEADYLFIGTESGPEREIVHLPFVSIKSGKLRRYFAWQNFIDFFNVKIAWWQSLKILIKFRPSVVLTAGSFVAVPVVWAAWVLRIPVVVHQQDIQVGLANKLMAPFATKITVTFKEQVRDFKRSKVVVTGNPVRKAKTVEATKPIIVITGGGLGARGMNTFVNEFIPHLLKSYEVHHMLGEGNWDQRLELDGYFPYKLLKNGMIELLSQAEIVISRAGMSLITEVAHLNKPVILIPMPNSHQERNSAFLAKRNAAFMVHQGSHQIMDRYLEKLLGNEELRRGLANNLTKLFPKYAVNDYIILINEIAK